MNNPITAEWTNIQHDETLYFVHILLAQIRGLFLFPLHSCDEGTKPEWIYITKYFFLCLH